MLIGNNVDEVVDGKFIISNETSNETTPEPSILKGKINT